MSHGVRVGYVRVSSFDQNPDRQLEHMHDVDRVFTDIASGKDTTRPQLQALLDYARAGDTIVVYSMDRLARNLDDLRAIVRRETARGVKVRFIKENLLFAGDDSPMATLMLSILGAVAQFERELIKERQREGIELAKSRGAYQGRKRSLSAMQLAEIKEKLAAGVKKSVVAREYGVSRETLYQYLRPTRSSPG